MGPFNKDYAPHVLDLAPRLGADPLLIMAMIEVESGGCRWATRFEPDWRYYLTPQQFALHTLPMITSETERIMQSTSWGLMQVMGSVARELGHVGHLTELTQTRVGLEFGIRQFMRVKRNDYSTDDQIAAYNAGRAIKLSNGLYQNQQYVDKVRSKWSVIQSVAQSNNLP